MGKVVGAILTVAAAVAIAFIPNVGLTIANFVFNSGLAGSVGGALAIGHGLVTAITISGVASLAHLAGLGPSAPKPETTETSIKNSRPARVSGYGRSRDRIHAEFFG
ncbi:MAG: hypothetical protein GC201_16335 [Alphaproteobacteria bacterium]|nr:hypothetical protein [Alphaproteobacteria bacterium]